MKGPAILIPVDFKVASLKTLRIALEQETEPCVNVILINATYQDNSITNLLFYSASKTINQKMSKEFSDGLEMIKNHFENKIEEISIKLIHSNNSNYFSNFAFGNMVSKIYIPKSYSLKIGKQEFNPIPLLKKSGLPCIEIDWTIDKSNESEQLSSLFK